jgi:hypothetical protein
MLSKRPELAAEAAQLLGRQNRSTDAQYLVLVEGRRKVAALRIIKRESWIKVEYFGTQRRVQWLNLHVEPGNRFIV